MYNLCAYVTDVSGIGAKGGFDAIGSALTVACGDTALMQKALEVVSYLAAVR